MELKELNWNILTREFKEPIYLAKYGFKSGNKSFRVTDNYSRRAMSKSQAEALRKKLKQKYGTSFYYRIVPNSKKYGFGFFIQILKNLNQNQKKIVKCKECGTRVPDDLIHALLCPEHYILTFGDE